uniref:glycoside hydrolase family 172 protein n=1 Tax=uncultured Draconibacterium sp. TaxID=1573823 RepID=UPI00321628FB
MKSQLTVFFMIFALAAMAQQAGNFNGMDLNMGNLYRLSNAESRSISPENFTGEKGKGGMATLEEGSAARAARELGQGWKVNPYINIKPGETFVLGEIDGEGVLQHIWMTPSGDYRGNIIRIYWDDEETPSVEVPLGYFFASGWGRHYEPRINSNAICVNPRSGLNSYWQMPFRKKCRITMENIDQKGLRLYYQIDYALTDVPDDAAYFHAQFRRVNPLPEGEVFTILDQVKGAGHYVGTYLARGAFNEGWFGEGEVKFYIDGDSQFPTICGTGEEDYFCGSYGYEQHNGENGYEEYTIFSGPYTGFHYFRDLEKRPDYRTMIGQYRWHIMDPVRFKEDFKVTIQSIGWKSEGRYKLLEDDISSVAYWYQNEPHQAFPDLPDVNDIVIK